MPKISIIIPCFNSSEFLPRCLESICKQTLQDIEILCIDDGSSDNTLQILERVAQSDNRFTIISLSQNCGAAAARNLGIHKSSSDFIAFVDSDDIVDPIFYETLYKAAESNPSIDIVRGNIKKYSLDGNIYLSETDSFSKIPDTIFYDFTIAIYKKSFILKNNIFFPENISICEDLFFVTKAISLTNFIISQKNVYYHYLVRQNSLSSKYYTDKIADEKLFYIRSLLKVLKSSSIPPEKQSILLAKLMIDCLNIGKSLLTGQRCTECAIESIKIYNLSFYKHIFLDFIKENYNIDIDLIEKKDIKKISFWLKREIIATIRKNI